MLNIELTHPPTHTHRTLYLKFTACRGVRLCHEALHNPRCTFCTHIGERPQPPPAVLHLLISSSVTSEKHKTLQGLLSSGGVCGWMSRCGCERVSVQQLPVQVQVPSRCEKLLPFPPERIQAVCRGITAAAGEQRMLGNGYQSQNLTYISPHISLFGRHRAWLPALFVCFFSIIPAEAEQIISSAYFSFLQWRRCLHRD